MRYHGISGGGNTLSSSSREKFLGFTLAEMMVVMLILSIILAAMAPVMTSRNKTASSSKVWDWDTEVAAQNVAYLRAGNPIAVIGLQNGGYNAVNGQRDDARLIINSRDVDGELLPQISFLYNSNNSGRFLMHGSNVFLGKKAGSTTMSSSAQNNVGIGADALRTITTGNNNIAIGSALTQLTTGERNTSVGTNSSTTSTGSDNTVLGANALAGVTTGNNNVAIGSGANNVSATRSSSTAVGTASSAANTSVALGSYASAGASSVAIGGGTDSTTNLTKAEGSGTIAIGNLAGAAKPNAIAIGYRASSTSQESTALGPIAIGVDSYADGAGSVAIGGRSRAAKNGSSNNGNGDAIAIGNNASAQGYTNSSGKQRYNSVAIGNGAEADFGGISIGALYYNRTGSAGSSTYNVATPTKATGRASIAIGNGAYADSAKSIAIGYRAEAKGENNVAIGYGACQYVTGSNKTCIGVNSGPSSGDSWSSDTVERIFIGGRSNFNKGPAVLEVHNDATTNQRLSWDSGRNQTGNTAAVVVNGNLIVKGFIYSTLYRKNDPDTYSLYGRTGGQMEPLGPSGYYWDNYVTSEHGGWGNLGNKYSDRRLKYVGKENISGLDKIRQLKVFNYTFKKDVKKTPHVGVIAQDLQKVFPNAVTKAKDGFLQIRMEDMFYAVVNAVKELDAKVTALTKEVKTMSEILKQVQSDNAQIKKDNQQLKRENQGLRKILKQVQDDNKKEAARLKALEGRVK